MLWFWGACGAFAYAAPLLIRRLGVRPAPTAPTQTFQHVADFVVAVLCGMIAGHGLAPAIGFRAPWLVQPNHVALAIVIGYLANAGAPALSKALIGKLAKQIDGNPAT